MKVRMLSTQSGAVDSAGLVVELHVSGGSYDLPDALADVYLGEGWAELDKAVDHTVFETKDAASVEVEPVKAKPAVKRRSGKDV